MTVSFTWNIPLTFQANNPHDVNVNVNVSIGQPYISNINGQSVKSPEQEKYDRQRQREWDDYLQQERLWRQQKQLEQQRRIYEEMRLREEQKKIKRQNDEISKVNWMKEGF